MQMAPDLRNTDYERIAREATAREAERLRRAAARPMGEERWYLAREGRRFSDEKATSLFDEYAVDCYTPKMRKMVKVPQNRLSQKERRRGIARMEAKLVSLFPTYRLLRFDLRRNDWRELFERAGIYGIICVDAYGRALPVPIADSEIAKLRGKEVDGAIPEALPACELEWKVGDQARICEGVWAGRNGTVHTLLETKLSDLDDEARCKLAMKIFGRVTLVEIPLHHIEKL